MKKLLCIAVFFACLQPCFSQQDALMSTYQFNQLFFNPAYAGANELTSFDLHYRSQWGNLNGAPRTLLFSGSTSVVDNQVGLGVSILHDNIGVIEKTDLNLTLAYKIDLSESVSLSFGMQGGLNALNYNFTKLNLDDPTDEDFIFSDASFTKPNFGTGMFLTSKNAYLGLSVPRLIKVTEAVNGVVNERYNRHYYFSGGFIIDKIEAIKLKPWALLRIAENAPLSYDVGASVLMANAVWAGLYTRNLNTVGLNLFFVTVEGIRLGFSGEMASNNLASSNFSTYEVSVGYDLRIFDKQEMRLRYY